MKDIVVGLDIGTSKICAIIARLDQTNSFEIIGVGKAPSMGLRKGEVTDIDRTVDSLKDAIKQAEGLSGLEILRGFVGVGGLGLVTSDEECEVDVSDKEQGVSINDVFRARECVKKFSPPRGNRLLIGEPAAFSVDGQPVGLEPLGWKGQRLKLKSVMFTSGTGHTENIYRIVNGSQVEVMEMLPNPLASAEAVLDEGEKNLGCLLIDIGGGTTEAIVYRNGVPRYATVLGIGGDHFDSDLAHGLGIHIREAERIKINFGSVLPDDFLSDEVIEITQANGGNEYFPVKIIVEILSPRMEEILELLGMKLHEAGVFHGLKAGVVLTGGASLLKGTVEKATQVLGLPARPGYPQRLAGLSNDVRSPIFSTCVGLVKLGFKRYMQVSHEAPVGFFEGLKRRAGRNSLWRGFTR
jgi:cell division protein FtsA